MTGVQLLLYLERRLAENGLTSLEAGREDDLYDALTEGRDVVLGRLALVTPELFITPVTLEADDADLNTYRLPAATKDPIRIPSLWLTSSTLPPRMLTPSAQLGRDDGDYVLRSPRIWQLRSTLALGATDALEVRAVLSGADIVAGTTEAEVGLPTPTHRAIGLAAAVAALTVDEESDASIATRRFETEMARLEDLYGSYDLNDGMKLRHALLASAAVEFGEMLP